MGLAAARTDDSRSTYAMHQHQISLYLFRSSLYHLQPPPASRNSAHRKSVDIFLLVVRKDFVSGVYNVSRRSRRTRPTWHL